MSYQYLTEQRNELGHRVFSYDSISHLANELQYLIDNSIFHTCPSQAGSINANSSWSWCMNTSLEEAQDHLNSGGYWAKGARDLAAIELPALPATIQQAPEQIMQLDVVGGVVDITEYLNGEVECMHTIGEADTAKPVTRIGFAVGYTAMVASDSVLNRGRAILALCDELEKQGKDVELYALCDFARNEKSKGFNTKNALHVKIKIKSVGQQIAPANFAFIVAHAAFLRRSLFRLVEAAETDIPRHSYGNVHSDMERLNRQNYDVYFPELTGVNESEFSSPENAVKTISFLLTLLSAEALRENSQQ